MSTTRIAVLMLSVEIALGTGTACAQTYPNKPIHVVAGSAGGGSDFVARIVQGISGPLGQPVVVDNRPANLAIDVTYKAPPDGYTLLVIGATLWVQPLMQKVSYDAVRDYAPVLWVERSPSTLAVHPSLPVKSVKELVSLAKTRPGELNYATAGPGSLGWLAMELFKSMAGIKIVNVPYKGTQQTVTAVASGEVQMTIADVGLLMPHAKTGRLRALAVTSAEPSALVPGLPPVAASLPGFELVGYTGIFAPAKTPDRIIERLNQEIIRVLSTADVKEKFFSRGSEVATNSPSQFADIIKTEIAKTAKIMKDAGIKVD